MKFLTTNPKFVFRLLSPIENTSIAGEGLAGATSDSAAGNGVRRGVTAGRWVASPLRSPARCHAWREILESSFGEELRRYQIQRPGIPVKLPIDVSSEGCVATTRQWLHDEGGWRDLGYNR